MPGTIPNPSDGPSESPGPVTLDSQVAFRGRVFDVRVDTIRTSDGRVVKRDIVTHPGAVVMAAVDAAGRVALVRQYRHAVGRFLLELPAGTLDDDEAPLAAAQRELQEEVGCTAAHWRSLGSFFSSPGFLREELHAFLATGLTETGQDLEDDEDIEIEWRDLEELLRDPGQVMDAKTLAGLILLQAGLRAHPIQGEE